MKLGKFFNNNSMLLILVCVVLIVGLVYLCSGDSPAPINEPFFDYDDESPANEAQAEVVNGGNNQAVNNANANVNANANANVNANANANVNAALPVGENEQPKNLGANNAVGAANQLPSECYPKDVLRSADLLPRDTESKWAQAAPNGQGSLSDQNFLNAGFHIGVNTVGQTLRNANYQLRSEPPNPQVKVSPWMQSTIEPDSNRKPLEIGA